MNIEQLLENVTEKIEDENLRLSSVGNRPHYPVFVAFNGADSDNCSAFTTTMRTIWSEQICRRILLYKYYHNGESLSFTSLSDMGIQIDDVYSSIKEVARSREVFVEQNTWCFYNILDTGYFNNIDDFYHAFYSLDSFVDIIHREVRSMAIVILRDSRNQDKIRLNYQIRDHLRNETPYSGVILLSDRTRSGSEVEITELYNIAANLVLLSDNDAITTADDQDYLERNLKLYSGSPLIVSYNYLKKPTYKILYRMTNCIVERVDELLANPDQQLSGSLKTLLGVGDNIIPLFKSFIDDTKNRMISDRSYFVAMNCMPMKNPEIFTQEEYDKMTFGMFKTKILQNSYRQTVMKTAERFFRGDICQSLIKEYEKTVYGRFTLNNVSSISMDSVNNLFDSIEDYYRITDADPIANHYVVDVLMSLLKDFIYPACKNMLLRVCDASNIEAAKDNWKALKFDINDHMPVVGFDQISEEYGRQMAMFLRTDVGSECINDLLKITNDLDDLYKALDNTLAMADNYSRLTINVPYIQMWATALNLQGDAIFRKIRAQLTDEGHKGILLNGEYTIKEELTVYMMHTTDMSGMNKTQLYSQFYEAFKGQPNVQFFNTGNDDAIESMQFYRCAGTDLVIGADS